MSLMKRLKYWMHPPKCSDCGEKAKLIIFEKFYCEKCQKQFQTLARIPK